MRAQIIHGIRSGIVVGIIVIFFQLIGFLSIISDLTGRIIEVTAGESVGLSSQMINMLIFLALLGLYAGISGAKRSKPDRWSLALGGGIAAGLSAGLLVAVFAYLVGSLNETGVRFTTYLAAMLPQVIQLFMLDRAPLDGAISHFLVFLISAMLGGLFARGVLRSGWRSRLGNQVGAQAGQLSQSSAMKNLRTNPVARYVPYVLVIIIVFLVPQYIGQYWNYTLGTVGIYVLLGLGLNIVVGLAGLLDLGYVAFFAIGAYAAALLTAPAPHDLNMSFWIALPVGIVLAALAGIILGIPVLRMRGDYLAIVTLGFGEIIRVLSKSDMLTPFTGGPRGVPSIAGPTLFGRPFNSDIDYVYLITIACILIIFVTTRLQNSRVGRAWIAMREDETVAQAMGINTIRYKLLAFAIGAAFAGLGGVLFAARNQFTGPEDHNLMVSINVLSLVIVGGMGSIPGVIAGAFVLKGLPEVLRELENYRILAFGALLVIMMIWRPEGLIPSARRRLEMHEDETVEEADEIEPAQPAIETQESEA